MKGYTIPRTATGLSSLVPPPPWHYVGDFLVVDYWASPEAVLAVLPEGLDPHQDAGRCAAVFADWQSCSEGGGELLDPVRSHYREFFVVVNALLVPYLLSAIRMLEAGHASTSDIDAGMRLGCAHPQGPLELSDLIGLDTLEAIAGSLYAEYGEPLYGAPPLLRRMTAAGLLGRKSGRGFYDYSDQSARPTR